MSSHDHENEREGGKHEALALQQPEQCRAAPEGRLDKLFPIDLGEQIVGSVHEFEVAAPRNLTKVAAIGRASLQGGLGMTVDWPNSTLIPSVPGGPLKFTYAPVAAGLQNATLTLTIQWTDGHVETRTVRVSARARAVDATPHDSAAPAARKPSENTDAGSPQAAGANAQSPDAPATLVPMALWRNIDLAHDALTTEQREGVSVVEREAAKFKAPPPERTLWQELVELAVSIGMGAVAGIISKYVTARITGILASSLPSKAAADAGASAISTAAADIVPEIPQSANELATQQRAVLAARVGNYAKEHAAKTAQWAEAEIGANVGAAVNKAFTTAATAVRGPQKVGPDKQPDKKSTPKKTSSDHEIAFFSDQRSMLTLAHMHAGQELSASIPEHLKRHPEQAKDMMTGIASGLSEAMNDAKEKQSDATAQQFMAYMARVKLGDEEVSTESGATNVTNLQPQRKYRNLDPAALAAGVLEIDVERDHETGGVSVSGARVHDISHLIADRLRKQPLAGSGVPLRFSVTRGTSMITVDEAGRVRVGGAALLQHGPLTEAQQIREAERIVRAVLSKTLAQWGLERIETNDASQPPPAKETETQE